MGTLMAALEADAVAYLVDIISGKSLAEEPLLVVEKARVRVEAARAFLEYAARARNHPRKGD